MRRLLPLVLLLLAGCGGHAGGSPEGGTTPVRTSSIFGDSALDLAVSGGSATATSIAGKGRATGTISVPDESRGRLALNASISADTATDGTYLYQALLVDLSGKAAVGVGSTFALGRKGSTLVYGEALYSLGNDGAGIGGPYWNATGGTAEVVGLTGTSVTLRLTGVTLASSNATDKGIVTVSGTVTGTIAGAAS